MKTFSEGKPRELVTSKPGLPEGLEISTEWVNISATVYPSPDSKIMKNRDQHRESASMRTPGKTAVTGQGERSPGTQPWDTVARGFEAPERWGN